ncbi:mechanosensitive ion channel family protein [Vitiosangium sp. GDMCC 1.1324]|uniref:mechanosensitive ion channel family protein n=1 Tax=Vitiosangium sp. (strain GDMCC 1.1324) TaxID=2138576 RepID=UPI000D3600F5|nr:mechanosensitive ion channel family protein [Vitiosangium sp. GDMCC 1.1324]PTL77059.1 mechanosensitive ion channel protein MscS [Vitiosangium sp. GDMCC 1.1324]
MLTFPESHLALTVGSVLTLVVVGARAVSSDSQFRKDLGGALGFLVAFLVLRAMDGELGALLHPQARQVLRVAWMLTFSFGAIRTTVSFGLLLLRLRSRNPIPKILRDVLDVSLYIVAVLVILKTQLDVDLTSLLATSAIVSVVLGLAMQDTLGNLFAGLSLQLERPYQVGDYVTIRDVTGRVVQIAWRATRIETGRKEIITLPNNVCSKEAVKNYSRGGLPVGVDVYFHASYDRAPNEVKAVVLEALQHVPLMLREPSPICRAWSYDETGIRYQVRYFVEDFGHADWVMEEVYTRIWYGFRREGIELPYPKGRAQPGGPPAPDFPEEVVAEMLRRVDLFKVFKEEERARLRKEMVPKRFARGEHIIEQGQHGNTFYLVGRGELSVCAGGVEVSRLSRGNYFGEMSLLTGEPRAATVVALTDVVLLELDRPVFARLFDEHPELAPKLSGMLAHRRTQLNAVLAASGESLPISEEHHILDRLKNIFRLS